jgi:chromosome segregation ATPase
MINSTGTLLTCQTATTTAPDMLGSAPGMVKRRAPKRDPSLQLFKPSGQNTGSTENNSTRLNPLGEAGQSAESVMKRKIQDLQGQISSLGKKKQKTMSEMQHIEPEILILHNKIEFLQAQKQKLQQSKRDKEAQIDVYSSEIEDLASKKKTLEDALDIVGGRF